MPAWSYSALTNFENCPRKFYLTRVAKLVKEPESEPLRWGNFVHKAFEDRLKSGTPLPTTLAGYEGLCVKLESGGELFVEREAAISKAFKPTGWWDKETWCRSKWDVAVKHEGGRVMAQWDWKGLALDTALPTPSGWTTMGDIQPGDELFAGDGSVCRVVAKSAVHHRTCYKLVFDDGTAVICDDEHLWAMDGKVIETASIAEDPPRPTRAGRYNVLVAKPLELPDAALLVDPYVLGAWLGDGRARGGEICKPDPRMWENIRAAGYKVGNNTARTRAETRTVYGLTAHLRALGVLHNKHIPAAYLRASLEQRLALLRGLMDTDGNVNEVRQQCVFTTCDKRLSDGVFELLLTLGQRPCQSVTKQAGFGKAVTAYPISFKPQHGINPFTIPRKADRVTAAWGSGKSWRRRLSKIEPVDTVPTQCIAVDSADNTYLCTRNFLTTHNTGKRKPDSDQMKLFAGIGFLHEPKVEVITTGFVWLKDRKIDRETFHRDQAKAIWQEFLPRVRRFELAHEKNDWPAKPSGLCRKHCPVGKTNCEFCGS